MVPPYVYLERPIRVPLTHDPPVHPVLLPTVLPLHLMVGLRTNYKMNYRKRGRTVGSVPTKEEQGALPQNRGKTVLILSFCKKKEKNQKKEKL
jgi:hypothetical protein